MASALDALITDHLKAWNTPAGEDRDRLLAEVYAADVSVSEPSVVRTGRKGMAEAISGLQAAVRGGALSRSGPVQTSQQLSTYSWDLGADGGPVLASGRDVVIVRDGAIAALWVIIDSPER